MVKKTVLKVDIDCFKCKKKLIKTVSSLQGNLNIRLSSLQGIDKIEADEGKGTLTIIGDADPYDIIVKIRKAGKNAEVVSIGPPPGPPPPKQDAPKKPAEDKKPEGNKKPEEKNKPDPPMNLDQISYVPYMQMPYYYPQYQGQSVAVVHMTRWDEPNTSCNIM